MNLTNFRKTSLAKVVEAIRKDAERLGVGIHNTELVGLIPQEALIDAAVWYTQLELFSPDQVLEQRIAAAAKNGEYGFISDLASATPTPGGGSAAAYSGAMAAGLVSMVTRLSIGKKQYQDVEKELNKILERSESLRKDLEAAVEVDSAAYQKVMEAYKESKENPERKELIQAATLYAAEVPLEVARKSQEVLQLAITAAEIGNKNAITDAGTALNLAYAAIISAAYNVRVNLASLGDKKKSQKMIKEVIKLEQAAENGLDKISQILTERGDLF
jgi:glutamate formiminotransferase/formiminotetrahydrofolate cyclodeaminase